MELTSVGRYERHGSGPPVLLLSNPQADPGWWTPPFVAELTTAGYEAVTFVHTGTSFIPQAVAADVASVIEYLDAGPVRLLGWSQGAAIAQEVALMRPDLVTAAALVAGYGRQNSMDRVLQRAWRQLDAARDDCDAVRLALLLLTSYPPPELGDDQFVETRLESFAAWATPQWDSEARRRSVAFIEGYQERLSALSAMVVPCLSVGFELDADTYVTRAREVADAIPGCRYVELPGAGHLTPITDPERVLAPVLALFTEVDQQS